LTTRRAISLDKPRRPGFATDHVAAESLQTRLDLPGIQPFDAAVVSSQRRINLQPCQIQQVPCLRLILRGCGLAARASALGDQADQGPLCRHAASAYVNARLQRSRATESSGC
jgi:hypothetical protein